MPYFRWLLRAWPVLVASALLVAHLLLLVKFPNDASFINKVLGTLLQVVGGLLVLHSVNQNLGLFRNQSLVAVAIEWLRDFPLRGKNHVVALGGVAAISVAGSLAAAVSVTPKSLEERVAEVERQLKELRDLTNEKTVHLSQQLERTRQELSAAAKEHADSVQQLRDRVEDVTIGGFKEQALGVLLAIHGSFAGALA